MKQELERMASKRPGRSKFSESMPDHLFSDIDTHKLSTIMHRKGESNHIWHYLRRPISNFYYFFCSSIFHALDFLE